MATSSRSSDSSAKLFAQGVEELLDTEVKYLTQRIDKKCRALQKSVRVLRQQLALLVLVLVASNVVWAYLWLR